MLRIACLMIFLLVTVAFQSHAGSPNTTTFEKRTGAATQTKSPDKNSEAYWRSRFEAQRSEVISAKGRVEDAKAQIASIRSAYPSSQPYQRSKARPDKRPLYAAKARLKEAQQAYLQLFDEARSGGALPGWYRKYEDELPKLLEMPEDEIEEKFPEQESDEETVQTKPKQSTRTQRGSSSSGSGSSTQRQDDDDDEAESESEDDE